MADIHYAVTYVDAQHVDKDDVRDSFRDYVAHYYTVAEVQALTTANARFIMIAGRPYVLDAADNSTADDGVDTIVSADGDRYKSISWSYALRGPDGTAALPGFRFQSDPDNGLYRSGTDLWHLVGGGAAILSVDGVNGRIGIGTSTPNQALSVAGRVMTTGSSYVTNPQGPIFGQYDSTTGYVQAPAGGSFQIWDAITAAIATFAASGNVGIGTTSPGCKLDVDGVIQPKTYTVATLPAVIAGGMLYASDGRKAGEGAGLGTGVLVFADGSNWIAVDTGATVAA